MSKQNYAVCCYTCEHYGQETCEGCNTILNGENESYENWKIREDLCQKDEQISELQKQLEEKEKDNQFLKKMYLSERIKNDNYHTEKYGLDKSVKELRKIKLTPKEKEIYYKGFDNCERQFATHIVELQQQLKSQPAEIVEKIRKQIFNHFNVNNMEEYESLSMLDSLFTADAVTDILDDILKEYQK